MVVVWRKLEMCRKRMITIPMETDMVRRLYQLCEIRNRPEILRHPEIEELGGGADTVASLSLAVILQVLQRDVVLDQDLVEGVRAEIGAQKIEGHTMVMEVVILVQIQMS
jgi:hypothetical protein